MSTGLSNISLAAFICAFKAFRRNSIWYIEDKTYKIAQALSMSATTIKKYLARCESLKLVRNLKGHKVFLSLREILPILFPEYHEGASTFFNHVRFYNGFEKTPTYRLYYERIKYALAEVNFKQQQWSLDRKRVVFDTTKSNRKNVGNRLIALMKAHKVGSIAELKSVLKIIKHIVTGKAHIAKLLGCSTPTAARLLRKWAEEGRFERIVIAKFIPCPVNARTYDLLKGLNAGMVVPNKLKTGFWVNQGSKIVLPTM